MALSFVDPSAEGAGLRVFSAFLYGPPKVGKTVGALSAPGPIIVVNAESPKGLRYARRKYGDDVVREVTFTGPDTFAEVYRHLRDGKSGERSVVFDSLPEIYRVMLEKLAGGPGKPIRLGDYKDAQDEIERYVRVFRDLPVFSVWIAGEEVVETGTDQATGQAIVETKPAGAGKRTPKLPHHFDVVAYVSQAPPEDENGPTRYMAQLCDAKGRKAGERFGVLGRARALDLSEWAEAIDRDFYGAGKTAGKGKAA